MPPVFWSGFGLGLQTFIFPNLNSTHMHRNQDVSQLFIPSPHESCWTLNLCLLNFLWMLININIWLGALLKLILLLQLTAASDFKHHWILWYLSKGAGLAYQLASGLFALSSVTFYKSDELKLAAGASDPVQGLILLNTVPAEAASALCKTNLLNAL